MERRFCCAKSVACGRVIEREWGNPQRFPPHTPPSLRYARVRTTKPEGNHKTPPDRVVLFRVRLGAHRRVSRLTAAAAADSRDTSSKAPRFIRRRRRFGAFLVARTKLTNRFRCHAAKTAWHQAFPGFSTPRFYRFQARMSEASERRST